jgi:hypothetical protein
VPRYFSASGQRFETGVQQHDRVFRNPAVLFLPRQEVGDSDLIVDVDRRLGGDIDHHRGIGQLVELQFVHRFATLGEMDRRVDVGAAVFRSSIAVRRVKIALRRHAVSFVSKRNFSAVGQYSVSSENSCVRSTYRPPASGGSAIARCV